MIFFSFTGDSGIKISLPGEDSPVLWISFFFDDDELIISVTLEANQYAH
jgi:hypothetical protein